MAKHKYNWSYRHRRVILECGKIFEEITVKNFLNLLTSNLWMNLSCSDNSKQSKYTVKPFTVQC